MLQVISTGEAAALSAGLAQTICRRETVTLDSLTGRVAAEDIVIHENVPAFRRSTMDGYAVIAADTFGAGEACPSELFVIGEALMGTQTTISIANGTCVKIPTGGMLPAGADAVIPVEYTEADPFSCLVYKAVSPGENVTGIGDDVKENALLFRAGTRFTPAAAGALAAGGICECAVYCRPTVGVISTGNEIVDALQTPPLGKMRDVNAHLLTALCKSNGCEPRFYGIVRDEEADLAAALQTAAAENDLVLLSGGSSAGERDLTAKLLQTHGEVLAHGVAMKPGKPTVIGRIGKTPVFGLPGHPAACYFVCETVVKPCIETLSGAPLPQRQTTAALTENVASNHGREEFVCVRLSGDRASPVYGKSGIVSQLTAADGYIRVPRDCEGLPAGETVDVFLF